MNATSLTSLLETELSEIAYSDKPDDLKQFGRDWTRFHRINASVVFFPNSIEEVQKIVKTAIDNNCVIIPSGGRTGYSAGAVAYKGEWIVSMLRMNKITGFNAIDQSVVVQAGVITEQLQKFAVEKQLFYPVDFASSGSSHIAGNIATNAGGIRVIRYGMTRDYVLGLTVVTGAGEVLRFNNGLIKNATGLDLRHLFVGSEGILGIIVEAEIKLIQSPPTQSVMLLAIKSLSSVMQVFVQARNSLTLSSFEFFSDRALIHVMSHRDLEQPFDKVHPFYLLLEFDENESAAMSFFEQGMESALIDDGILAQSLQQSKQLWQYREGISEAIAHFTPYKNDISVKVSKVPTFVQQLDELLEKHYPDFEILWFGHIGDGNLHLNILKPQNLQIEEFKRQCEQLNKYVYGLVRDFSGSISAEHGVGLLKKNYLKYSKAPEEIHLMQTIKKVFDPHGVFNIGKVVD